MIMLSSIGAQVYFTQTNCVNIGFRKFNLTMDLPEGYRISKYLDYNIVDNDDDYDAKK